MSELRIDPLLPQDLPAALALSTLAGWNQLEEDWRRLLALSPDGCFAGRLDGRLVATATSASPAPGIRWIGMVLVDESCRGRGFGRDILQRALDHAGKEEVVGLDATDLGRPLYLKLGFRDVAPIDRWAGTVARPARDGPAGLRHAGASTAAQAGDVDTLLRADREASGVDRSPLLRRLAAEPGARILRTGGGVAVLRRGRSAAHLGPVIAPDVDTFDRLLGAVEGPFLVDVPRSPQREAALKARGLELRRPLMRMTRGVATPVLLSPALAGAVCFEWA